MPRALLVTPLLLAGCGAQQNALAPESHQSRDIASLWWWMLGGAFLGVLLIAGILFAAWIRRDRRGIGRDTEGDKPGERVSVGVVLGLGIATPIAVIAALFVLSDIFVIRTTQAPAATRTAMTVQVIGHQWYWEIRYPGTAAVTANELHIPVNTPVNLEATTADVVHSVWVPRLNRKIDTIPGQTNRIVLDAQAVGRYRGQCAEYCGLQHAHMSFYVFVQTRAAYDRWLANEEKPAISLPRVFVANQCASCHTIRGTPATGDAGPDLTHIASRTTIGALTLPNDPRDLGRWIGDPGHVKPGVKMPAVPLTQGELHELVTYLESLR